MTIPSPCSRLYLEHDRPRLAPGNAGNTPSYTTLWDIIARESGTHSAVYLLSIQADALHPGRIQIQAVSFIMHVNDLLRLNGTGFVETAYSTILKRQADRAGLDHFMARLAAGDGKEAILVALATSPEARGSRIDLVGLQGLIKKWSRAPWRRFLRFFSEMLGMRRQLARIEYMLSEQGHGYASTGAHNPPPFTESGKATEHIISGDDLNRTLVSLQRNLSDTAHDSDLFIDHFRKTIRSSPLFFVTDQ